MTAAPDTRFLTVIVADGRYGIRLSRVTDMFRPRTVTPLPRAPKGIHGLINRRGRVVTAISLRACLGLPAGEGSHYAIGVVRGAEPYALLADAPGEICALSALEPVPGGLVCRASAAEISEGVYGLDGTLLTLLDVDRLLGLGRKAA